VLSHCGLAADDVFLAQAAERIHFPGYYKPKFNDAELAVIERETAAAARRFGYGNSTADTLTNRTQSVPSQ
jgi:hypothetical protein